MPVDRHGAVHVRYEQEGCSSCAIFTAVQCESGVSREKAIQSQCLLTFVRLKQMDGSKISKKDFLTDHFCLVLRSRGGSPEPSSQDSWWSLFKTLIELKE